MKHISYEEAIRRLNVLRGSCRLLTTAEAARLLGVSRQAINWAITKDRLPAEKVFPKKYFILFDDLDHYVKTRWDRHETTRANGVKVFNKESGILTAQDAATFLGVPTQHIYYAIRSGYLGKVSAGYSFVINEQDVRAYAESNEFKFRKKNTA